MKTIGRKTGKILAAAAAALCLSIAAVPSPARADALIEDFWLTMYDVDYYVVVDAPDGGVNLRYGAGAEYPIQLDEMIPNGTILHIDAEARANNGKYWGATEYDGWYGFIFLGHTKKTDPPAEETTAAVTTAAAETTAAPETTIAAETNTAAETSAAADNTPAEKKESQYWEGLLKRLFGFIRKLF